MNCVKEEYTCTLKLKILITLIFSFFRGNRFIHVLMIRMRSKKKSKACLFKTTSILLGIIAKHCSQNNGKLYFKLTAYQWCKKMQILR